MSFEKSPDRILRLTAIALLILAGLMAAWLGIDVLAEPHGQL